MNVVVFYLPTRQRSRLGRMPKYCAAELHRSPKVGEFAVVMTDTELARERDRGDREVAKRTRARQSRECSLGTSTRERLHKADLETSKEETEP